MIHKKILLVNKAYWPLIGGVETVVRQIAEGVLAHGFETTVLCLGSGNQPPYEKINGVHIYRIPSQLRIGSATLSFNFFKAFRELAADVDSIHFHYPNPAGELALLLMPPKKRTKILCTYHSDPLKPQILLPAYSRLTHAFLKKCDHIIATSPNYISSSKTLTYFKEKISVIPLAIDAKKFTITDKESTRVLRKRLQKYKPPYILFCGRLVYYKGIKYLIESMQHTTRGTLVIVGNGPLELELKSHVHRLGINHRVCFLSTIEDSLYPAIYTICDLFVLPSIYRTEAFGIVGLEAMAAGLPIVTTEIGTGTSFYNSDGKTGYIIPPQASAILGRTLEKLLVNEPLRKRLGDSGSHKVQSMFSIEKMLQSYVDLYNVPFS